MIYNKEDLTIRGLIRSGNLAFSEAAEDDLTEEEQEEEETDENNEEDVDNTEDDTQEESEEDTDTEEENSEDEEFNEDDFGNWEDTEFDEEYGNDFLDDETFDEEPEVEEIEVPEAEEVKKIQTVDVIAKYMDKFDSYLTQVDQATWLDLVQLKTPKKNSKIMTYWNYVEDVQKCLNITMGNLNLEYVNIYNDLFDKLTINTEWKKGLLIYTAQNYGKPFITEALFMLMYELSFEWACFLVAYLEENPEIDPDNFENDSFVNGYEHLILLTYIANLLTKSEEFDKFMTSGDAFKLLDDETEFNLTMKQIKAKSDLIKSAGESFTYYANLVRNDYGDIVAGALDKLGIVVYLSNNCDVPLYNRFNIITELITAMTSKKPLQTDDKSVESTMSLIKKVSASANNLQLARKAARMKLNANKDAYITRISNSNE